MKAQLIEKELIANLHFRNDVKVLRDKRGVEDLFAKLKRSTALGNLEHVKITIYFRDDEGVKKVETTIWATTENYILLKSGVFIPINSIIDVVI